MSAKLNSQGCQPSVPSLPAKRVSQACQPSVCATQAPQALAACGALATGACTVCACTASSPWDRACRGKSQSQACKAWWLPVGMSLPPRACNLASSAPPLTPQSPRPPASPSGPTHFPVPATLTSRSGPRPQRTLPPPPHYHHPPTHALPSPLRALSHHSRSVTTPAATSDLRPRGMILSGISALPCASSSLLAVIHTCREWCGWVGGRREGVIGLGWGWWGGRDGGAGKAAQAAEAGFKGTARGRRRPPPLRHTGLQAERWAALPAPLQPALSRTLAAQA